MRKACCCIALAIWAWCYAHRLELACKDALTSCLFRDIDEMLLRLYHVYEKSPKKCRELSDLIDDLREVFEYPEGGNLPVRAYGSRWISYKQKAPQRVVDHYGAYLTHISALTEECLIKSADRQRLKGYLLKWREARMLIGSALYVDVLKPASHLSLTTTLISYRALSTSLSCIAHYRSSLHRTHSSGL